MQGIERWIGIVTGVIAIVGVIYSVGVTQAKIETQVADLKEEVDRLRERGSIQGKTGKTGPKGDKGDQGPPGLNADFPSGAVVAFSDRCPKALGWTDYEPGAARFIIGAGEPTHPKHDKWKHRLPSGGFEEIRLTSYRLSESGGEERVTLIVPEIPSHRHEVDSGHADGGETGSGIRVNTKAKLSTTAAGGGNSHNNMPPYIALYFCEKV